MTKLTALLVISVIGWLLRRQFGGGPHPYFEEAAEKTGLTSEDDELVGELDGVPVWVGRITRGRGRSRSYFTVLEADFPTMPADLVVTREGAGTKLGKLVGLQDIEIGLKDFDAMFRVKADASSRTRSWLVSRPKFARHLVALARGAETVTLQDGHLRAELYGWPADGDAIVEIANFGADMGRLARGERDTGVQLPAMVNESRRKWRNVGAWVAVGIVAVLLFTIGPGAYRLFRLMTASGSEPGSASSKQVGRPGALHRCMGDLEFDHVVDLSDCIAIRGDAPAADLAPMDARSAVDLALARLRLATRVDFDTEERDAALDELAALARAHDVRANPARRAVALGVYPVDDLFVTERQLDRAFTERAVLHDDLDAIERVAARGEQRAIAWLCVANDTALPAWIDAMNASVFRDRLRVACAPETVTEGDTDGTFREREFQLTAGRRTIDEELASPTPTGYALALAIGESKLEPDDAAAQVGRANRHLQRTRCGGTFLPIDPSGDPEKWIAAVEPARKLAAQVSKEAAQVDLIGFSDWSVIQGSRQYLTHGRADEAVGVLAQLRAPSPAMSICEAQVLARAGQLERAAEVLDLIEVAEGSETDLSAQILTAELAFLESNWDELLRRGLTTVKAIADSDLRPRHRQTLLDRAAPLAAAGVVKTGQNLVELYEAVLGRAPEAMYAGESPAELAIWYAAAALASAGDQVRLRWLAPPLDIEPGFEGPLLVVAAELSAPDEEEAWLTTITGPTVPDLRSYVTGRYLAARQGNRSRATATWKATGSRLTSWLNRPVDPYVLEITRTRRAQ